MQKVRCRVVETDNHYMNKFVGTEVTITAIDRVGYGCGTPWADCVLDTDPPVPVREVEDVKAGYVLRGVNTDTLEPIDTSMVPETHNKSALLRRIWVFHTASCDAWNRGYPDDLNGREITQEAFMELYGKPWKDERLFDVGKRNRYGGSL